MRMASASDVPRLVALMDEFYAEGGYPLNHRRAVAAFDGLLADERFGRVWLIQSGGQDVGHVVLTVCYSMEYGGPVAFIDDLFVQKAFRGAGLATAALADVRAFAVERGIRAIHLEVARDNAPAQAAYRRAGFHPTDRQLLTLKLADPTHAD